MQDSEPRTAEGNSIGRYEAFLREDPDNTLIRLNLGDLCQRAGQFDQAEACFAKCMDDAAYRAVAMGNLAKLRLSQSRLDEAESLLRELLATGDEDPALQHNLGIAL